MYAEHTPAPAVAGSGVKTGSGDVAEPEEDELDALLAEDETQETSTANVTNVAHSAKHDNFDDEEEAMAGMW